MSFDASFLSLLLGGRGGRKTGQKKPKKLYSNYWEKLKGDELKALCRAAKLPVSGTNAALCDRLCQGELSAPF
ncbi:hypothetical protein ACHAWF_004327, partial [Thalassiosira exigua]